MTSQRGSATLPAVCLEFVRMQSYPPLNFRP